MALAVTPNPLTLDALVGAAPGVCGEFDRAAASLWARLG